jgi:pyridoxal phosphate enzyme (YggS family)
VTDSVLHARLGGVRERIARAAGRVGRDPSSVTLLAVSKTFPSADIRAAFGAGQIDFGENKVQEAIVKMRETDDLSIRWHLLGHLQSNKARKAAASFDMIHSIDNEELVHRLDRAARDAERRVDVLLQVDLAGEITKTGIPPASVRQVADAALSAAHLRLRGLMLLPPASDDPEDSRGWFARLRELRDELVSDGIPAHSMAELSMGMSGDFEIAIEEGATIVRVGSAIFGSRA